MKIQIAVQARNTQPHPLRQAEGSGRSLRYD